MDIRQLLAQGYQAADRFLPFDGVLDPMFAPPPRRQMPQAVGAMPNMQSRFAPQQPAPMPQQMPAPVQAPRRGGNDFGRTMMEFIDPSFNRRADERSAAMAKQAQQDEFLQFAKTVLTDPREQLVFRANPEKWGENVATRLAQLKLGKGEAAYVGGENVAYNPDFMEVGPNVFSTNLDGTVDKVGTRDMTPEELLQRQVAEAGKWEQGGGNYFHLPFGGATPVKGPAITAVPQTFAPRVTRGGGGGSGYSDVPAGAVVVGGQ
jgi:hypothetical protein